MEAKHKQLGNSENFSTSMYSTVVVVLVVHAEEVVEGGGRAKAGIRVLCLDGGSIRGLIQIEILSQVGKRTL